MPTKELWDVLEETFRDALTWRWENTPLSDEGAEAIVERFLVTREVALRIAAADPAREKALYNLEAEATARLLDFNEELQLWQEEMRAASLASAWASGNKDMIRKEMLV